MRTQKYSITNYDKLFYTESSGRISGPLLVVIGLIFSFGNRGNIADNWSLYIGLFFVFIGVLSLYFSIKFMAKLKDLSTGEMYKVKAKVIGYKVSRSTRQIQVKYEIDGEVSSCILSAWKYSKVSKELQQLKEVVVYVPLSNNKICFLDGYVTVIED